MHEAALSSATTRVDETQPLAAESRVTLKTTVGSKWHVGFKRHNLKQPAAQARRFSAGLQALLGSCMKSFKAALASSNGMRGKWTCTTDMRDRLAPFLGCQSAPFADIWWLCVAVCVWSSLGRLRGSGRCGTV